MNFKTFIICSLTSFICTGVFYFVSVRPLVAELQSCEIEIAEIYKSCSNDLLLASATLESISPEHYKRFLEITSERQTRNKARIIEILDELEKELIEQ